MCQHHSVILNKNKVNFITVIIKYFYACNFIFIVPGHTCILCDPNIKLLKILPLYSPILMSGKRTLCQTL